MLMRLFCYPANIQVKVLCMLQIAASRLCGLEACDMSNANRLQLNVEWDKLLQVKRENNWT